MNNISVHRIGTLRILFFKIQNFFVWQYSCFLNSAKIYTIFRISIKNKRISIYLCIWTPLYITCWILLLLNSHCMWLTSCEKLSLLFIHCIVLSRTLQKPISAVFTSKWRVYVAKSFCCFLTSLWHILRTLHNLSFAGFELQARQNWYGMPSPMHFFDHEPISGIKMGENRLWCDSSAAFNGPYWLPQWYWSVSVNFTKWIMNLSRRKSFWTKTLIPFFVYTEVLIHYNIFLQNRQPKWTA